MNAKKNYFLMIGLLIGINLLSNPLEVPANIISGLSSGREDIISTYFESTVELTIDNKENVYSSKQAQIILKDFFKKNPPEKFTILHEGGKGASKYAIGNLKTSQGQYRITILLKQVNNKTYIKQLIFEKDEV